MTACSNALNTCAARCLASVMSVAADISCTRRSIHSSAVVVCLGCCCSCFPPTDVSFALLLFFGIVVVVVGSLAVAGGGMMPCRCCSSTSCCFDVPGAESCSSLRCLMAASMLSPNSARVSAMICGEWVGRGEGGRCECV